MSTRGRLGGDGYRNPTIFSHLRHSSLRTATHTDPKTATHDSSSSQRHADIRFVRQERQGHDRVLLRIIDRCPNAWHHRIIARKLKNDSRRVSVYRPARVVSSVSVTSEINEDLSPKKSWRRSGRWAQEAGEHLVRPRVGRSTSSANLTSVP